MKRMIITTSLAIANMGYATIADAGPKEVQQAIHSGQIKIGMDQYEFTKLVGYPPEGKTQPDIFYERSVTKKRTAEGLEEIWQYHLPMSRSFTSRWAYFKFKETTYMDGSVKGRRMELVEWYES